MPRVSLEYRALQVYTWLETHWVTPYPCYYKWVDEIYYPGEQGVYGDCGWDPRKRSIVIRLSRKICRRREDAIHTLQHEYAHAITTPNWRVYNKNHHVEDHPDEYWLAYGRIYRAFYDNEGWRECFSLRP